MNHHSESNEKPVILTRRAALIQTLKGAVTAAVVIPALSRDASGAATTPEPEFVPENDYPFFGGELPEGYQSR